MDFRPLSETDRARLLSALRDNAERDRTILVDPRDTSFVGSADATEHDDIVHGIRGLPCHY